MSKNCKQCGHLIDDNEHFCPNCGHPTEDAGASTNMDNKILNKGKSTKAESILTDVADTLKLWFNAFAYICLAFAVIGIIAGFCLMESSYPTELALGILFYSILLVVLYFFIKLLAIVFWGLIMLFVNMSTTLKRIEIQLEKKTDDN